MTDLWVPDTARINHDLESQLERLGRRHEWLKYFDRELQAMDPRLSLVKASETATQTGLKPGYWHIKRDNEQTMATYYPLQGEEGEFVEPGSEHLEMMRRNDLTKPENFDRLVRQSEAHLQRLEEQRRERAEQRQTEFAERYESAQRAQVSMKEGWTNSVKGKKATS